MERYGAITNVTFAAAELGLPMSVRVVRRAQARPAGSDADRFATSVELDRPTIGVEVRTRDTAAAEGLPVGQDGELTVELAGTRAGQAGRRVRVERAVLTAVELHYDQREPACVSLHFAAEAPDGAADPFAAEEVTP